MPSVTFIGITGPAGSGKDTFANLLKDAINLYGPDFAPTCIINPFANNLKSFCMNSLGMSYEQCYGSQSDKQTPTNVRKSTIDPNVRDVIEHGLSYATAREVMQHVGTHMRKLSKDFWVDLVLNKTYDRNIKYVIIPDVRFLNECLSIRTYGGIIVRMVSDSIDTKNPIYNHISEVEMQGIEEDYLIKNEFGRKTPLIKNAVDLASKLIFG